MIFVEFIVLTEDEGLQVALLIYDRKGIQFVFPDDVVGFRKRDVVIRCNQFFNGVMKVSTLASIAVLEMR